jgi:hypothetical protein
MSTNIDYLSMSDEDMMNASPDFTEDKENKSAPAEDPPEDDGPADGDAESDTGLKDLDDKDREEGSSNESGALPEVVEKADSDDEAEEDASLVPVEKSVADGSEKEIDYKAEFARLTTPFKANGKDIQVRGVDDAIALMQMGANYNKKMAALKPHLKLMKMLENNQLMTEEKISYLIDLGNKNPAAIQKLVKDSGIDPLSIDSEKPDDYQPTSYKVDDREVDLDTALDEIQDSPTYNRTLEILGTKWDGPSKQVIANSPQLVKVINDHVQSGIYDVINKEVERERMFGRLNGLSDIEAYREIGDALQARGGFSHLVQQEKKTPNAPVVVTPKPKNVEEDKLRDKRRAASGSTPSAPASKAADFNPLALSDDAFNKIVNEKFL